MNKRMPILKPSGYRKDVAHFFKESLIDNDAAPVVAYGFDKGSHIEYEGTGSKTDFEDRFPTFKKEALENLSQITPHVEIVDLEGSKVAFVTGHEYASEKILDPDFMKDLGEQLGTGSLMVGVPFKGHMIAASSTSTLRGKLPAVVKKYYDNPQQDVISPYVFLVESGVISAIAGQNIASNDDFGISEDMNSHNFTVTLDCKNIEELANQANASYQRVLLMAMQTGEFGGDIYFKIKPNLPLDQPLKDRCLAFVENVHKNEMAQGIIGALSKNGIRPIFSYDGQQIAPDLGENPPGAIGKSITRSDSAVDNSLAAVYAGMSDEELKAEFESLVSAPDDSSDILSLKKLKKLMVEYANRGLEVPSESKRLSDKQINVPDNIIETDSEKRPWWKFWA